MSDFEIEVGVRANTSKLEKQLASLTNANKTVTVDAIFSKSQINKALKAVTKSGENNPKVSVDVTFTKTQIQKAFKKALQGVKDDKNSKELSGVKITFSTAQVQKELNKVFKEVNESSKFQIKVEFNKADVQNEFKKATKELPRVEVRTTTKNKGGNYATKAVQKANEVGKSVGDSGKSLIEKVSNWYLAQIPIRLLGATLRETKDAIIDFDSALTEFKKVSDLSGDSLNNYVQELGQVGTEVARTRSEMIELAGEFKKSGFSDEDAKTLAEVGAKYQNVADTEITAAESAGFITSQIRAFNLEAKDGIQVIDKVNEVSNNFSVSSTNIAQGMAKQSSAFASFGNDIDETIAMITAGTEILTNQPGKVANGLRSIGAELVNIANESGALTFKVNGANKSVELINEQTGELVSTYEVLDKISSDYWDKMTEQERANLALTIGMKTQYNVLTATMSNWSQAREAYTKSVQSSGSAEKENERAVDSLNGRLNNLKATFGEIVLGSGGINNFAKTLLDVGNTIMKALNNPIARSIITMASFSVAVKGLTTALSKMAELTIFTDSTKGIRGFINSFLDQRALLKTAKNGYDNMAVGMQGLGGAMDGLKTNASALGHTLSQLWATMSTGTKVLGVLGIALMAYTAISNYSKKAEAEKEEAYNKASSEYDEAKQQTEKLTKELDNNTQKLEDNINMMNKRGNTKISSDENIKRLKEENKLLEDEINFQKEIEKQKATEKFETGKSKMFQAIGNQTKMRYDDSFWLPEKDEYVKYAQRQHYQYDDSGKNLNKLGLGVNTHSTGIREISSNNAFGQENGQIITDDYERLSKVVEQVTNRISDLKNEQKDVFSDKESRNLDTTTDRIKLLNGALKQEESRRNNISKEIKAQIDNGENELRYLDKGSNEYKRTQKEVDRLKKEYGKLASTIENTSQSTSDNSDAINSFNEGYADVGQNITDLNTEIDNMQSAWDSLSAAQDNYNQHGYITLDQFQSLMNISPQILSALADENGNINLNATAFDNLTDAILYAKIQQLEYAAAEDIAKIAGIDLSNASGTAQGAVAGLQGTIATAGNQAVTSAQEVAQFTGSVINLYKTLSGGKDIPIDKGDEAQKIVAKYENIARSLAKMGNSVRSNRRAITGNTGAAKRNTGAHKKNTGARNRNAKAIDKQSQALERQKNKLEKEKEALENYKTDLERTWKYLETLANDEKERIERAQQKAEDNTNKKYDKLTKPLEAQIEKIEERDYVLEKQIDKLQEKADKQLENLEAQNDELNHIVEKEKLLLELAKAREQHKMVYKSGVGFVFESDASAISEARNNLADYERSYAYDLKRKQIEESVGNNPASIELKKNQAKLDEMQHQLDTYEKKRDKVLDRISEQYEKKMKPVEEYIEKLEKLQERYDKLLNKASAEKILGGELKGWQANNKQLETLTKNYINTLKQITEKEKALKKINDQLKTAKSNAKSTASAISSIPSGGSGGYGGFGGGSYSVGSSSSKKKTGASTSTSAESSKDKYSIVYQRSKFYAKKKDADKYLKLVKANVPKAYQKYVKVKAIDGNYVVVQYAPNATNLTAKKAIDLVHSKYGKKSYMTNKKIFGKNTNNKGIILNENKRRTLETFATGTPSIKSNQLALVGDAPNRELVIGSKLNGQLMNLSKGDGVVNARSTRTLAGILNNLSRINNTNLIPNLSATNGQCINIQNITLPQVKNGQDFVNYLKNFKDDLIRRG